MREAHLAGKVNKGAGYYGAPAPTHVTRCVNSNNAAGHNPACPCGWAYMPLIWEDEEVTR